MKKRYLIIIIIQTVLMGLFFVFALVKKLEADDLRIEVEEQFIEARKARDEADMQRVLAEEERKKAEQLHLELVKLKNEGNKQIPF